MSNFVSGERVFLVNDNYKTREVGYLVGKASGAYATYTLVLDDGSRYRSEGRLEKIYPLVIKTGGN